VITTIRVVHRANTFKAKGMMLKGMGMSEVGARCRPKLSVIAISTEWTEVGKPVRGIGQGA